MPISLIPSNWAIHVISAQSSDTSPTIMFSHEHSRAKYIFNAGENSNRTFTQSKMSWSGTRGIFLTGLGRGERDRAGGLTSLLMSLADGENQNVIDVVGPPGIKHLVASMRMYTYRENLSIISTEVPADSIIERLPSPIFKDVNIAVYAIPVYPSLIHTDTSQLKRKREDEASDADSGPPTKKSVQEPSDTVLSTPTSTLYPTLMDILSSPSFAPEDLNPGQSQQWYDLISDIMFPASSKAKAERAAPEKEVERRQGTKKQQPKKEGDASKELAFRDKFLPHLPAESGEGNVDEYGRLSIVKGFHSRLPKLIPVQNNITSPSALSISYLAIGPSVRGKFDGAKADALGIPHNLRKKLTAGETVTFMPLDFSKRKKRKSIPPINTTEAERTVRPEDVIAPSQSPVAALILDIPSPSYIPSIIATFEAEGSAWARWTKYSSKIESVPSKLFEEEEFHLHTVFHLLGEGVLEDERYRSFMSGFRSETEVHHIVSSKEHSPDPVTFTSSAYQLLKLAHLDSEIFQVPKFRLTPQKDIAALSDLPKSVSTMQSRSIVMMRPLAPPRKEEWAERIDKFHSALKQFGSGGDITKNIALSIAALQEEANTEEVTADEGFVLKPHTAAAFATGRAAAASYGSSPGGWRKISEVQGKDVNVITLGTGSAIPGKYRNVSATVLQIPKYGNILLDCGEGTWGQLCRKFGTDRDEPDNVYAFLRDLKVIYISHAHADHHMGVGKILAMRKTLDPPPEHPLYLVSLRSVHLYLRELSDLEDLGLSDDSDTNGVVTVLSPALHWRQLESYCTTGLWAIGGTEDWLDIGKSRNHAQKMCEVLNLKSFFTVDVRHRTRCYGCVIRSRDGWSVTFSADTMPSDNLVYAANSGHNTTSVLIHEATMSDDQKNLAAKKAHSTIGQAIEIGQRMNASNILLTHFSARQPKMPHQISSVHLKGEEDLPFIVTAFDYAHFKIGSMWKMQFYMDAIDQSYREMVKEVGEENEADEEEKELLGASYK
ncbi:hypothetical protein D9757_008524 [Collybiopsis confluens]|uniref:ribonuclease Z n=1 Tax=Collybiopsis confluens TaxID=2823264 RepID=A0A8H5H2Y4_9AGAR|nr:hypothetical protein D9757_008524 [Collybiopsis confluens]